jgi:hypothetical protein
MAIIKG